MAAPSTIRQPRFHSFGAGGDKSIAPTVDCARRLVNHPLDSVPSRGSVVAWLTMHPEKE